MVRHHTSPVAARLDVLPGWATLVRAPNPGPMTLDGTNTWVLRAGGARASVVVDPGPLDEGHLRAVAALGPVAAIVVTHGHPDHTDGVSRLAELTGAPVQRELSGTVAGLAIQTLPTPGHTADSICFLVCLPGGAQRAVLTGDSILGRGTTVVAWPDGDLGGYLDSLRRLAKLVGVPALPGHGPALADCAAAASFYLDHRRERLEQVRAALRTGAQRVSDVVRLVYADVDPALWPAAEWSVRAQLAYLRGESHPPPTELDEP